MTPPQSKVAHATAGIRLGCLTAVSLLMMTCVVAMLRYEPPPRPSLNVTIPDRQRNERMTTTPRRPPPSPPIKETEDEPSDPCSLTADDICGWSAARITAAFQACAEATGYTEDPTDHTAGMIACRTRLRDTARLLAGAGHLFRWAGTGLETMFSDRHDSGNVTTYTGAALDRRRPDRDAWHFCCNCSKWPKKRGYKRRLKKPTDGELCDECRSKRDRGECD